MNYSFIYEIVIDLSSDLLRAAMETVYYRPPYLPLLSPPSCSALVWMHG